jgi:hypothetical protein
MTTVGDLINRLYRTWLYPPNRQPATSVLASSMTTADPDTLALTAFVVPEDEQLMRVGSIMEVGSELMRVESWDTATLTGTVSRGKYGTTPTVHASGADMILGPPYPRQTVFEMVGDQIQSLYPRLYTVDVALLTETAVGVAAIEDNLATEVIELWLDNQTHMPDFNGRIVEYHPSVAGRALLMNRSAGSVWMRYRRRMARPTTEADELKADCGVEDMWAIIIMAGVAADLFAGADLSESHVEWVQSVLQAENISVGTRAGLSGALLQYRDLKLREAQKEMRGEDANKIRVHRRSPYQVR